MSHSNRLAWSQAAARHLDNSANADKQALRDIGAAAGTDKILHHRYDFYYPRFLEHLRQLRDGAMLEIGIERGQSLNMWLNYLDAAFIYGIDINTAAEGDRYKIFKADQSDQSAVTDIIRNKITHPVFLIVDDGSHLPEHQAASFDLLFTELLVPGGTYIIEDIEVSYWTQVGLYGYQTNYGYRHPVSIIELFKDVVDDMNTEFLTMQNRQKQDASLQGRLSASARAAISSVTFGKNCIIIAKKTEEEQARDQTHYRFAERL